MNEQQVIDDFIRWATRHSDQIRGSFPTSTVRYYANEYAKRNQPNPDTMRTR